MKNKLIILLITIAAFNMSTLAQVTVTAKRATYTRPKPIMDFKRTFTVTYPRIKAATPSLSKKIEAVLSYEKVFDFKLREEMNEIQWLEEASYDVNYNANNMLSISLTIQGTGAYPSGSTKYIVVNTAAGSRVRPIDVFVNTSGLLAKLVKMKDAEIKKAMLEVRKDPETKDDDLSGIFSNSETYSKVKLEEFEIDENGVIFHHDYGFPHAALALQPPGEFFLTWKELKPYIKSGGLLAHIAR